MKCCRRLIRISCKVHSGNKTVREKITPSISKHKDLITFVKESNLRWFGQVTRANSSSLANIITNGTINRSINEISMVPISLARPGLEVLQPNQCSTAKSVKQFRNINRPSGVLVSIGERPSQRMCLQMFLEGSYWNGWNDIQRLVAPLHIIQDDLADRKGIGYKKSMTGQPATNNGHQSSI